MDYSTITLKGCLSVFILTICYKIYKMKIKTHSGCCGETIQIETENTGGVDIEMNGV